MQIDRKQDSSRTSSAVHFFVATMFAISGCAALILEVAWTRWLTAAIGSSAIAIMLVLGVFMTGFGLGSWLIGRVCDSGGARSLRLFSLIEAVLGVWAFISIPVLGKFFPSWAAGGAQLLDVVTLPWALRALLALSALIIPTMLMGATLPLLATWAVRAGGVPGYQVGRLYAVNLLGGAVGALLAAFLLIGRLGIEASVALAGLAELTVGAAAGLLGWRMRGGSKDKRLKSTLSIRYVRSDNDVGQNRSDLPSSALAAATGGLFVSGFCGLGLEVIAHRVLSILTSSSAYAFAVMLASILIGMALGSLMVARIADRVRNPGGLLSVTLGGLALGIGVSRFIFHAGWWQITGSIAQKIPGLASWNFGMEITGCLLALLPPAVMLGAMVPVVGRFTGAEPGRMSRQFGLAYAMNTFGAVAGAVVTALLIIPSFGTAGGFTLLTSLAAITGVAIIPAIVPVGARRVPAIGACMLGLAGLAIGYGTDPVRREMVARAENDKLLALIEGPVQTIAVREEFTENELGFLRLFTGRTSLSGTHLYGQRYMKLLGHLPVLCAQQPRRALVICLGTGMTAAAVVAHPEIEHVDVAEISPEVVEVSSLFAEVNGDVLSDPRVHLHVEDGRHLLLAASEPWDLITLEPPPPRNSGVVSLYSSEFYQIASRRLTPNGALAQWIPMHSQSGQEVRMLIRSFVDVFPQVIGFLPVERELILIGTLSNAPIDVAVLTRRMSSSSVRESLGGIGLDDPADLLATAVLNRDRLIAISGDAPPITDDHPRIEYFAPYGKHPAIPAFQPFVNNLLPLELLVDDPIPTGFSSRFKRGRERLLALNHAFWAAEKGDTNRWEKHMRIAVRSAPNDPYTLWAAGLSDEHIERARRRAENGRPQQPDEWRTLGDKFSKLGDVPKAIEAYRSAYGLDPNGQSDLKRLIEQLGGAADEKP